MDKIKLKNDINTNLHVKVNVTYSVENGTLKLLKLDHNGNINPSFIEKILSICEQETDHIFKKAILDLEDTTEDELTSICNKIKMMKNRGIKTPDFNDIVGKKKTIKIKNFVYNTMRKRLSSFKLKKVCELLQRS